MAHPAAHHSPYCWLALVWMAMIWVGPAHAVDTYDGLKLTIPDVTIGAATYTNMIVTVDSIVSGPSGNSPGSGTDRYDPADNQLTIPAVTYGARTYYNVVIAVGSLISVEGVTGADVYNTGTLTIPAVKVGAGTYTDVVLAVTPQSIVQVAGGMPAATMDRYDVSVGRLLIPAVQAGGRVYTNVTINAGPGNLVSIGSGVAGSPTLQNLTYSPAGAYVGTGSGMTVQVNGQCDFSTPRNALASATITVLNSNWGVVGSSTVPIQGAPAGSSGSLPAFGSISTATPGVYTLQVFVTDAAGRRSNTLFGNFKVNNFPWSTLPTMPLPRWLHAVVAAGNSVYVIGGGSLTCSAGNCPQSQSVEIFDTLSGTWSEGPSIPISLWQPTAASVGGVIYVVGGNTDLASTQPITNVWALDTTNGHWTMKSAQAGPLGSTAVVLNNLIYVMGGFAGGSRTSAVNVYNPSSDSWSGAASLPGAAAQFGAGVISGRIEAFAPQVGSIEYDPVKDAWSTLITTGPSAASLTGVSTATAGGLVYAIGGFDSLMNPAGTTAFDPASKAWISKESPTISAGTGPAGNPLGITTTATSNGRIYQFLMNGSLVYDPANDLKN